MLKRRPLEQPWAGDVPDALEALQTSRNGLSGAEAANRLVEVGPNALPETRGRSALSMVLEEFTSPLIDILIIAAAVSLPAGSSSMPGASPRCCC